MLVQPWRINCIAIPKNTTGSSKAFCNSSTAFSRPFYAPVSNTNIDDSSNTTNMSSLKTSSWISQNGSQAVWVKNLKNEEHWVPENIKIPFLAFKTFVRLFKVIVRSNCLFDLFNPMVDPLGLFKVIWFYIARWDSSPFWTKPCQMWGMFLDLCLAPWPSISKITDSYTPEKGWNLKIQMEKGTRNKMKDWNLSKMKKLCIYIYINPGSPLPPFFRAWFSPSFS